MLQTIIYKEDRYPILQTQGHASKYAREFAKEFCKGSGFDIGCNRKEWALIEDAILVDPEIQPEYHAMNLPNIMVDYFCSSHMIEHYVGRWQDVIEYWMTRLRTGGIIFLYLPNCDHQKYWAYGNKKHVHYLNPAIMKGFCEDRGYEHIVTEGYDLNSSFYVVIAKS